jgi:hypothetical protein
VSTACSSTHTRNLWPPSTVAHLPLFSESLLSSVISAASYSDVGSIMRAPMSVRSGMRSTRAVLSLEGLRNSTGIVKRQVLVLVARKEGTKKTKSKVRLFEGFVFIPISNLNIPYCCSGRNNYIRVHDAFFTAHSITCRACQRSALSSRLSWTLLTGDFTIER